MDRFKYKVWKGPIPDYCVCIAGPPSHSWIWRELRIPSTPTVLILASGSPIRNIKAICLFHQSGILLLFSSNVHRGAWVFRKPHCCSWVWTQCRSWEMYCVGPIRHSFLLTLVLHDTLIHWRQERVNVSRAPEMLSCCLGHSRDCASAALTLPWHCANRTTLEGTMLLFSFPEHCHCAQSQSCAAQGPPPCTVLANNSVPGHVLAVVKRHIHGTLFALSADWCGGLWRVCSVGSLL